MRSLVFLLVAFLILGTGLLGLGAAVHPVLTGDPASDLRLIAAMVHWRRVHLLMLAGTGFVITGIWVRVVDSSVESATAGLRAGLLSALGVVALGEAINALNIAYMAGAGTHIAALFVAGRSDVMPIFDTTHPIGLMAAWFGNLLVALGALILGMVEWLDSTRPRWVAWLAWLAAVGGLIGVSFFPEASRAILAAVALLSGWQLATALLALRGVAAAQLTGALPCPRRRF